MLYSPTDKSMRFALISARANRPMIMWRMSRGIILHILLAHSRNVTTRPFNHTTLSITTPNTNQHPP